MRKSASKTVMPSYPEDALKKREQGVAVVEVNYDAKGDVVNTSVLESPSQSVGDAVVKAVGFASKVRDICWTQSVPPAIAGGCGAVGVSGIIRI